jgi:hypothetical protein
MRNAAAGVVEAGVIVLLVIVTKALDAGGVAKAAVAGSTQLGLFLSLAALGRLRRIGWSPTRIAATGWLVGSIVMVAASTRRDAPSFVIGVVAAMAVWGVISPFQTAMYEENYPAGSRGRLASRAFVLRIACTMAFGQVAGWVLNRDVDNSPFLVVAIAAAMAIGGLALLKIPTAPMERLPEGEGTVQRSWSLVTSDRMISSTLAAWMLMGFANLMMLPLRVEFLSNERFGPALRPGEVTFYTVVLPNAARLLMSPVWGRLFDRMNFFSLRIAVNLGFALGIAAFFTGRAPLGLALGSLAFGVAAAGGDLAWTLWVTKFAPPGRTTDYMAVHTFLTGVRGITAPLAAYWLVEGRSILTMAMISSALIVASSAVLIPSWRTIRDRRLVTDPGRN